MEHPFTAVFSGAHGVANGLNAVLDAARELLSIGEIDIKIEFIGDGKVKPELIERCENEQLVNCKFTDPMPKIELFSYLSKNADVGLMVLENVPAFYNGTSPNKFFDYLSLQLPVLNNYPGWLAGLIEDYGCGIVVQPGNAREFAKGLVKLRNNPILLTQMGYNAKLLSEKKFSRPHLSNQFVEFLEMR